MSNVKESKEQLGISVTTARHRLNKIVMFNLAQRLGLDVCFRCDQRILTPRELSVDHKKPWFKVSKELFWDLSNIAFSHLSCNSIEGNSRHPCKRASSGQYLPV